MLWIGVDENLVALKLDRGTIAVSLSLFYPLFEILEVGSAIVVITELEVLVFNQNGSLRFTKGLPDIAAKWSFQGEKGNRLLRSSRSAYFFGARMTMSLTNDDGIDAPGIRALLNALDQPSILVAPRDHYSGGGHQVTTTQPIQLQQRSARFRSMGIDRLAGVLKCSRN